MIKFVQNNKHLFANVPTQTPSLTHDIDVTDAKPIHQPAYQTSPFKRNLMKQETDCLVQNGFAKHSKSPYSSARLVEQKPDSSPRFNTNYGKPKSVTVQDSYPLPLIEDCVDSVGPATYVT